MLPFQQLLLFGLCECNNRSHRKDLLCTFSSVGQWSARVNFIWHDSSCVGCGCWRRAYCSARTCRYGISLLLLKTVVADECCCKFSATRLVALPLFRSQFVHFVSALFGVISSQFNAFSSSLWTDCRLPSNFVDGYMLTSYHSLTINVLALKEYTGWIIKKRPRFSALEKTHAVNLSLGKIA